jgi:hypothetical protein
MQGFSQEIVIIRANGSHAPGAPLIALWVGCRNILGESISVTYDDKQTSSSVRQGSLPIVGLSENAYRALHVCTKTWRIAMEGLLEL